MDENFAIRMNILIFSWRGPKHPHAGGAEYSSHEHARGWIKAGHEVTLFTSTFNGAKEEEYIDGIRIIRRGRQVFGVHILAIIWYLFSLHPKFDIVVDEIHGIPFFTPIFVRTRKLGFIHEVAKEVWKLNPWPKPFNLIPALIGTFVEPLVFSILYRNVPFITVSESTKADLIKWDIPDKNITVVNNGFRGKTSEKGIKKENKKTIIYLGALSQDKGIEDAIEVFKILSQKEKNWQFWVVGKGEVHYLQYLKKKVADYLLRNVKFFEFVNENKKYDLLAKAHVLINPSIREGWGLVVIEAASVGTPTVAYNVAGLRDSVIHGKTGLLSDPNPQSCAEKINYLLENKSLYKALSKKSKSLSKKFSWDRASRESLELLEKINNPANS